ncbi:MAG: EAL domain-containing protein [Pseudomonadota bacterium]
MCPSKLAGLEAGALSKDFFLARQPILDRAQNLYAYELLFRNASSGGATVTDDLSATASVIAHVSELGMEQVVGNAHGLLNIDAAVLLSDFIKFLPHDKVILEILETVKATPEVLERVHTLKAARFKFALDDVICDSADVRAFLPLVDLVKVDIMDMPLSTLSALARTLRSPARKLLAEKVETLEQFQLCLDLGFDYFQGYYFAKPVILSGKKLAPSELAIMQLLNLIDSDADNADIERAIKHDALISINLLRLVNTPAAGASARIDSLAQALMLMGRRQLQRWLQILLYAKPGGQFPSPLLQLASTRGKLLELLAGKLRPGQRAFADVAFTVGIMSLMEALFSMPMAELMAKLSIADEVRLALLERKGVYGDMLTLVETVEKLESGTALSALLRQLNIAPEELYALQLAAFEWVNKVTDAH